MIRDLGKMVDIFCRGFGSEPDFSENSCKTEDGIMIRKAEFFVLALLLAGTVSACGQEREAEAGDVGVVESAFDKEQETSETDRRPEEVPAEETESAPGAVTEETSSSEKWNEQFGAYCISEQTFEVELSEYSGKVCFVPFRPSGEKDFYMQIVQDETVLTEIKGYVPEKLAEEPFKSLDAVSFFDVNYDGYTDIVLIETYGDTSFAAIYYGFAADGDEYERFFWFKEQLSEQITKQADVLTIPAIRELLTGGRKNGTFTSYQEAYETVSRLLEMQGEEDLTCNLIQVDGDGIPELAAGVNGYYTDLYTYHDGTVYMLMDHWAYGAMGNAGYDYAPGKNSLRNYNSDYAGAIVYTTYMEISDRHTLDITVQIETFYFDDVNGNGVPDEDEMESAGRYSVSYIDGKTVTEEECVSCDAGGYEPVPGDMSLQELRTELRRE